MFVWWNKHVGALSMFQERVFFKAKLVQGLGFLRARLARSALRVTLRVLLKLWAVRGRIPFWERTTKLHGLSWIMI